MPWSAPIYCTLWQHWRQDSENASMLSLWHREQLPLHKCKTGIMAWVPGSPESHRSYKSHKLCYSHKSTQLQVVVLGLEQVTWPLLALVSSYINWGWYWYPGLNCVGFASQQVAKGGQGGKIQPWTHSPSRTPMGLHFLRGGCIF